MYPSVQRSRLVSFALVTLLLSLVAGTCHKLPAQDLAQTQPSTQEQPKPGQGTLQAEERVKALVEKGDLKGLEAYTIQVITLARDQGQMIKDQQAELVRAQELLSDIRGQIADSRASLQKSLEDYQQFTKDAGEINRQMQQAIIEERAARQKAMDMLLGQKRRALWGFINAASLGASIGGWTTDSAKGAAIGAALTTMLFAIRP